MRQLQLLAFMILFNTMCCNNQIYTYQEPSNIITSQVNETQVTSIHKNFMLLITAALGVIALSWIFKRYINNQNSFSSSQIVIEGNGKNETQKINISGGGVVIVNGQTIYAPNGVTIVNGQIIHPTNITVITDAGEPETKEVDISDVRNIDASGFGNLSIEQSRTCPEVLRITAGKHIMPHLKHDISGIQLNLGFKDGVVIQNHTIPSITYHAIVQDINKISISSSIKATTNNIQTDNLELNMRNSSTLNSSIKANRLKLEMANSTKYNASIKVKELKAKLTNSTAVTLTGEAHEQDLTVSSSATYNAENLTSQNTRINIKNSALARLNVMNNLYYKASNSSRIFYQGNAKAEGSTSNSAKVRQI